MNISYQIVSLTEAQLLAQAVAADFDAFGGYIHKGSYIFAGEAQPEQCGQPSLLRGKGGEGLRELGVEILVQGFGLGASSVETSAVF